MSDYRARRLHYRPLLLGSADPLLEQLGLDLEVLQSSFGPGGVVVYCVETSAPHPTTPILASLADFEARFEPAGE